MTSSFAHAFSHVPVNVHGLSIVNVHDLTAATDYTGLCRLSIVDWDDEPKWEPTAMDRGGRQLSAADRTYADPRKTSELETVRRMSCPFIG
jgi:hypothetical protein